MFGITKRNVRRPANTKQNLLKTAPVSAAALATHLANKNATLFGESLRRDTGTAYPFFYSFVPYPYYDKWQLTPQNQTSFGSPGVIVTSVQGGVGPDGYYVPAANANGDPGQQDILIRMDRDLNFDMLEVRYAVRFPSYGYQIGSGRDTSSARYTGTSLLHTADGVPQSPTVAVSDSFPATARNDFGGFPLMNAYPVKQAAPYSELVRVSLYAISGVERSIYGGQTFINRQGNKSFEEVPVPITALQGTDMGKNVIRTPYLIAKSGVVRVRIRNFSTTRVLINGYLFGYKVAY